MAVLTTGQTQKQPHHSEPPSPRRVGMTQRLGRWDVKLSPYLYISPFFVMFALVGAFPLVYTAYVSMYDWNLLGGQGDFVGLQNFADVLSQPHSGSRSPTPSRCSSSRPPRSSPWRSRSLPCWIRTCAPPPSGAWACWCPTSWHPWPSR